MMKHGFTLAWILTGAMALALLGRLALAPDLVHFSVVTAPGSARNVNGLLLLPGPVLMALTIFATLRQLRRAFGSPRAIQAWRDWWGTFLLAIAFCFAVLLALFLASSLGVTLPVTPQTVFRGIFIYTGLLILVLYNRVPKLPFLQSGADLVPALAPAGRDRVGRLGAQLMVGIGLAMLLTGAAGVPHQATPFLFLGAILASIAAQMGYAHWLRQRQG